MTESIAVRLTEAVDRLNALSEFDMNTEQTEGIIKQLEEDWQQFRAEHGDMCDDVDAFTMIGFHTTEQRPGIVDAYRKFLQAFCIRPSVSLEEPVTRAFLPFMQVMTLAVDDSEALAREVTKQLVILYVLTCLEKREFLDTRDADSFEVGLGQHVLEMFRFFANVLYRVSHAADLLNAHKGKKIMFSYDTNKIPVQRLRVLITLSYLVTDPSSEELQVDDSLADFIADFVDKKIERLKLGTGDLTLYGLLAYLDHLIRCSETCGAKLVKRDLLDKLSKIISLPLGKGLVGKTSIGEKMKSVKICWALALGQRHGLENAKRMLAHEDLMKALEEVRKLDSEIQEAVDGATWHIKNRAQEVAREQVVPDTNAEKPAETPAVKRLAVISYSSDWKPELVQKISNELRKLGVPTWLHDNKLAQDKYEDMALAIEESVAVIVCYSNAYAKSDACRSEISYARDMKKLIIAVRVEDFVARGWLGMWLAGKPSYDLATDDTDEDQFAAQIEILAEALKAEFVKHTV